MVDKKGRKLEEIPNWMRNALQGLTFWIGHRRCLYSEYPLLEGALVAETCNLIHANLKKEFELKCEVLYKNLVSEILNNERADMVIYKENDAGQKIPKFVIEVKRFSRRQDLINNDIKRLSRTLSGDSNIRAFLFVVSEAQRPTRFVNDEGVSIGEKCLLIQLTICISHPEIKIVS